MVLSIAGEIERCRKEQKRCLNDWERTGEVGALLGVTDWFTEEYILCELLKQGQPVTKKMGS